MGLLTCAPRTARGVAACLGMWHRQADASGTLRSPGAGCGHPGPPGCLVTWQARPHGPAGDAHQAPWQPATCSRPQGGPALAPREHWWRSPPVSPYSPRPGGVCGLRPACMPTVGPILVGSRQQPQACQCVPPPPRALSLPEAPAGNFAAAGACTAACWEQSYCRTLVGRPGLVRPIQGTPPWPPQAHGCVASNPPPGLHHRAYHTTAQPCLSTPAPHESRPI